MERDLPLSIDEFPKMVEDGYLYVDKTAYIHRMAAKKGYYFLSRPRRFGKTLLVDTIQSVFESRRELFDGLYIQDNWTWDKPHPVVRLSFVGEHSNRESLNKDVLDQLADIEDDAKLEIRDDVKSGPRRLRSVIRRLKKAYKRPVVFLVDEYDKPILDVIDNPKIALENRDYLSSLYGIVKGISRDLRFVFVTGISMFTRVSLFSGMNNLNDISLNPEYNAICGFTEEEIDRTFGKNLTMLDRSKVRKWYNGYNWTGPSRLYCPSDLLQLLDERKFRPYWFRTGNPSYLFKVLMNKSHNLIELNKSEKAEALITKFDVDDISAEALLFQSGYLTIMKEKTKHDHIYYELDYPNHGVRISLHAELLRYIDQKKADPVEESDLLGTLLVENDFDGFCERLQSYWAGFPYQWSGAANFSDYEAWYTNLLFAAFSAVGLDVRGEESSTKGRADLTLLHGDQVFIFELKVVESKAGAEMALDEAMAQMRKQRYADKFRGRGKPIHLIAIVCGKVERNLLSIRVEPA